MSNPRKRAETPTDTLPSVADLQIELFRQASVARRVALLRSMSRTTIELSRGALRRARSVNNGVEASLAFVALNYDSALSERLKDYLSPQRTEALQVSPPDILAALSPVVDVFEELEIDYHIAGSVASSAHGVPRTTVDIDLVADLKAEHVVPFTAALQSTYYVDEETIRGAIARRGSFNLIHFETMLKVDIFIPKGRAFDREAAHRVESHPLEEVGNARRFNIASAEDVILAKLEWYRLGGKVSERQWSDVLGVLKVQGDLLDREYLRKWADQLGVLDLLQQAFVEAEPHLSE